MSVGVLAGAAVIPPVLELINKAYGFAGAPGVDPTKALAAKNGNAKPARASKKVVEKEAKTKTKARAR